ncbi:MAG TPA: VIT1/CCC1 transporter family protein [Chloroflexota bacterium]|nr:VIT1/CCC1 transporter family protein [Chloroflexota bacterium]
MAQPQAPVTARAPVEKLFRERQRIANLSQIREVVFGMQDGLLTTLGVVTSVYGATANNTTVLVAGFAEAVAGALAMAAGEYQASKAQHELHSAEISKERQELEDKPEEEHHELRAIFQREGLSRNSAEAVTDLLSEHPELLFRTHVEKELGLRVEEFHSPIRNAGVIGLSFVLSALVPIVPYLFLSTTPALALSVGLTIVALAGIGIGKAAVSHRNYLRSSLEVVGIGLAAAILTYLLGTFIPRFLGH